MTETVQLAVIASIAPTLVAAAALVQGLRNGALAKHNAIDAKIAVAAVSLKQDEIHASVNGNLSKVQEQLDGASKLIEHLHKCIERLGATRDALATATANARAPAPPVLAQPVKPV